MSSHGDVAGMEPGSSAEGEDAVKAQPILSVTMDPGPGTTSEGGQTEALGHDDSHLLSQPTANSTKLIAAAQHLADNREPSYTRHEPTTSQIRQVAPENSTVASLKHEHSSRTQSPLRESSVPAQSTETANMTTSKPPAKPKPSKKGTATVSKASKSKPSGSKSKKSAVKKLSSTTATPATSSPAPRSGRGASSPPRSSPDPEAEGAEAFSEDEQEEDGGDISDPGIYCLCRRPDTGTFMIGCDGGCDDWFHGKCVGISEKDKGLIDKFICPECQKNGLGITTWMRMCRRESCRNPAKVQNGSKYCSDTCGVLFFKEKLATKTRKAPDQTTTENDSKDAALDLGPKGGLVSKGELKALVKAAPTLEQFKRLGDDVFSSSTTSPDYKSAVNAEAEDASISLEGALNDIEREHIEQITHQKETARTRHSLLKDRAKFITMLKKSSTQLAEERAVKPKDFCGFDSRITWTEDQFNTWRSTPEGQEALQTGTLPSTAINTAATDADGDTTMTAVTTTTDSTAEPCTKRRCARHFDWAKLALEDTRFEINENGDTMRALDKEEQAIKERARLRAREIRAGGVGGSVEFHGQQAKKLKVEHVDVEAAVAADKAAIAETEVETVAPPAPDVGNEGVELKKEDDAEAKQDEDGGDADMHDAVAGNVTAIATPPATAA